ncbi:MAG: hypothetical protein H0U54_17410 [Acidobacteria bacterium]|nr:hypothetical protein [Acidobacteriota bacterium]
MATNAVFEAISLMTVDLISDAGRCTDHLRTIGCGETGRTGHIADASHPIES